MAKSQQKIAWGGIWNTTNRRKLWHSYTPKDRAPRAFLVFLPGPVLQISLSKLGLSLVGAVTETNIQRARKGNSLFFEGPLFLLPNIG